MTKRAVFLDRDGTLIEHHEVLTDPNQLQLIPAVPTALKLLRDRGFLLVMVTNQSAVAKGKLKEKKTPRNPVVSPHSPLSAKGQRCRYEPPIRSTHNVHWRCRGG